MTSRLSDLRHDAAVFYTALRHPAPAKAAEGLAAFLDNPDKKHSPEAPCGIEKQQEHQPEPPTDCFTFILHELANHGLIQRADWKEYPQTVAEKAIRMLTEEEAACCPDFSQPQFTEYFPDAVLHAISTALKKSWQKEILLWKRCAKEYLFFVASAAESNAIIASGEALGLMLKRIPSPKQHNEHGIFL